MAEPPIGPARSSSSGRRYDRQLRPVQRRSSSPIAAGQQRCRPRSVISSLRQRPSWNRQSPSGGGECGADQDETQGAFGGVGEVLGAVLEGVFEVDGAGQDAGVGVDAGVVVDAGGGSDGAGQGDDGLAVALGSAGDLGRDLAAGGWSSIAPSAVMTRSAVARAASRSMWLNMTSNRGSRRAPSPAARPAPSPPEAPEPATVRRSRPVSRSRILAH